MYIILEIRILRIMKALNEQIVERRAGKYFRSTLQALTYGGRRLAHYFSFSLNLFFAYQN